MRPDLPVTVVEKVISLVSRSLMEALQKKYNIAHSVISAEMEKTRELATLKLADGKIKSEEVEKLVDQLFVFAKQEKIRGTRRAVSSGNALGFVVA